MPYITKERRKALWNCSYIDRDDSVQTSGELNYMITELFVEYLEKHGLSYKTCSDIVSAGMNAVDEFQRRVQHPYENKKIKENGDVYPKKFIRSK